LGLVFKNGGGLNPARQRPPVPKRLADWLKTAYREYDELLAGLRTNFQFDSLRSDSSYTELVRKIGFSQ
jgi:hypothetical protein